MKPKPTAIEKGMKRTKSSWKEKLNEMGFTHPPLHQFIEKLLSKELQKAVEEENKELKEKIGKKYNPTIFGGIINRGHSCYPAEVKGYNRAIDDILEILKPTAIEKENMKRGDLI